MAEEFNRDAHVMYFLRHTKMLPQPYEGQDQNRLVLLFFAIQGLAVLGELKRLDRHAIIEYVYGLQVHPDSKDRHVNEAQCGFRGSPWIGNIFLCKPKDYKSTNYDTAHLASTYAAVAILYTLGDDLSRVNKGAILKSLKLLQNPETGSFKSLPFGSEEDMRFVFCACAISDILHDWSAIDKEAIGKFVSSCVSFDGGFGITPGLEAQGGATFCGIASLVLIHQVQNVDINLEKLIHWLTMRQCGGFQGRCNKDPDSCYAFWNGASLAVLNRLDFIDLSSVRSFILRCQHKNGGFAKYPDTYPDIMHSYYSLAWLSIANEDNLVPLNVKLQIPGPTQA